MLKSCRPYHLSLKPTDVESKPLVVNCSSELTAGLRSLGNLVGKGFFVASAVVRQPYVAFKTSKIGKGMGNHVVQASSFH